MIVIDFNTDAVGSLLPSSPPGLIPFLPTKLKFAPCSLSDHRSLIHPHVSHYVPSRLFHRSLQLKGSLAMDPQESRRLVPILPAQQISGYIFGEDHSPGPSSPPHRLRKRVLVAVACEGCRRKKAKVRCSSLIEDG